MEQKEFDELVKQVGEQAATKISEEVKKATEGVLTKAAVEEMLKEYGIKSVTDIKIGTKSLVDFLTEMGENVESAKKMATSTTLGDVVKNISQQFADAVKADAEGWAAMVSKKAPFSVTIKDAGTMLTTNVPTSASTLVPTQTLMPGVVGYKTNDPLVLQYANVMRTNTPNIDWIDEVAGEGDAGWTAEGATKPLLDVNVVVRRVSAKKVAVAAKASDESLADIPFLQSLIETRMRRALALKIDDGLLNGDGTGEQPYGISYYAPGFTSTEMNGTVTNPNYFDALGAAATQIQRANFMPNIVFINPVDWFVMMHKKDAEERYVLMALQLSNGNFLQMTAVKSNQVPAGTFIMGDMNYFRVAIREDIRLEVGWENDDFRKNLRTLILEGRLSSFVSENEKLAFVMDEYDNVTDAIAAAQI